MKVAKSRRRRLMDRNRPKCVAEGNGKNSVPVDAKGCGQVSQALLERIDRFDLPSCSCQMVSDERSMSKVE